MIDFTPPTDEALMLRESAGRFLADAYSPDAFRAMRDAPAGAPPPHWATIAQLGWFAAPFSEADGGLGLELGELAPLLEAAGAGLLLEPFVPVVLGCGRLMADVVEGAEREAIIAGFIDGSRVEVLAASPSPFDDRPAARARRSAGGWAVDGRFVVVPGAATAGSFVVPAGEGDECRLFRVEAAEVARTAFRLMDGRAAAAVEFRASAAVPIETARAPEAALSAARARVFAAECLDAVGAMTRLLEDTVAYVKEREQFGQPIGRFQTVQHGLADLYIAAEEARSLALVAAQAAGMEDAGRRRRLLAAARVKVGAAARRVAHGAIQYHGGMGMTDAMRVGLLAKRLLVFDTLYGRPSEALDAWKGAA